MQLTEEQQPEERLKNMSPEEIQGLQKQQCVFCQIIAGKIPAKTIYEDDTCMSILDINPAAKGHLLLIPREHYPIMPNVPDEVISHLFLISQKLSQVLLKSLKASGTNVFIANGPTAGQRTQHFLIHIIPRKDGDHLLDLPEKIISREMQQKVKLAVEGKLLELLGQRKVVKKEQEKKTAKAEVPAIEAKKESPNNKDKKTEDVEEKPNLDDIAELFK